MPRHIVIVGGGVGGTITANLLVRSLMPTEAKITLIESSGYHVFFNAEMEKQLFNHAYWYLVPQGLV